MPKLSAKDVQKIVLPSNTDDDPSFVMFNFMVTAPQMFALQREEARSEEAETVLYRVLSELIEQWSYTDADGNPAPITPATIAKMRFDDLEYLAKKLTVHINMVVSVQAVPTDAKKA